MFDVPVKYLKKTPVQATDEQLDRMTAFFHAPGESIQSRYLSKVKEEALKHCVYVDMVQDNTGKKPHTLLVFSVNKDNIEALKSDSRQYLPVINKRSREDDNNRLVLDWKSVDITDINKENYFSLNKEISLWMQHAELVRLAFEADGYPVPPDISRSVALSISELDAMRAKPEVPQDLRQRYETTFHKAVKEYSTLYEKDNIAKLRRSCNRNHEVPKGYFSENFIPVINEGVRSEFIDYLIKQVKSTPRYEDFIFYREKMPFSVTKDLSKQAKDEPNGFYKDDVKVKEYRITFPASVQWIYYSLMNEYNIKQFSSQNFVSPAFLMEHSHSEDLELVYVHKWDLPNFDRLCSANNAFWALEIDEDVKSENAQKRVPVLYRKEDSEKIGNIINRLAKEQIEYDPASALLISEHYQHQQGGMSR